MSLEDGKVYEAQVIGCGPAGIGVAVALDNERGLPLLLQKGAAFIDSGGPRNLGKGGLNRAKIMANSTGQRFYGGVREGGFYADTLNGRNARRLAKQGNQFVPLDSVAVPFLGDLGRRTGKLLENAPQSDIFVRTKVVRVDQTPTSDGNDVLYTSTMKDGRQITSRSIVFATGAEEQPIDLGDARSKVVLSHDLITGRKGEMRRLTDKLAKSDGKNVAILGGSHGAFSSALRMLQLFDSEDFGDGSITIIHRSPVRAYYESATQARQHGYEYDQDEVCWRTGRVGLWGGIRGEANELYERIRTGEEQRVRLLQVADIKGADDVLQEAAVIVQALGYKPRKIPIFDSNGAEIGPVTNGVVQTDQHAQMIGYTGEVLPHAYALGLGHGLQSEPKHGGERNYYGTLDSVDVFHKFSGHTIAAQILDRA